jgi:hypothetical protein
MKKILVLVVVLAFIWAIPPLRTRVSAAALPVLVKLGPVGEFMITPARNYEARQDAGHFSRVMVRDRAQGREVPEERGFQDWLLRRIPEESGLDPWGSPYWMERALDGLRVGSDGADGERGTSDDVTHTERY